MGKANFNFLCCCSVFHSILFRSFWSRSLLYCILVFVYSCFGFSCFLCVCLPSLRFSIRIAWWFSLRYVCMLFCLFYPLYHILFYRKNPFRPFTLLFFVCSLFLFISSTLHLSFICFILFHYIHRSFYLKPMILLIRERGRESETRMLTVWRVCV